MTETMLIVFTCLFALWAVVERILSYRERQHLMNELADVQEEAHKREVALLKALREASEGQIPVAVPIPSPSPMPRRNQRPMPPSAMDAQQSSPHLDDEAEALYEQMRASGMTDEQIMAELVKRQAAG